MRLQEGGGKSRRALLEGTKMYIANTVGRLSPWLAAGSNVVTKSSANFTMKAEYRRWWR